MKTASAALISYLDGLRSQKDAALIMADCFTFTLLSGLLLTYTNADVPVQLNGFTFLANSVLVDGLQYKSEIGLDVDQQKLTISARPTDTVQGVPFLQALCNGVFDGCEIKRERAFLSSWQTAGAPIGSVILFKGRLGTIDNVGRTTADVAVNSDLVLLDLNMPRMNGLEFMAELRADEELHSTVVFILTTSSRDLDRSQAYRENAAGYIVKSAVGPQFSKLTSLLATYGDTVRLPERWN